MEVCYNARHVAGSRFLHCEQSSHHMRVYTLGYEGIGLATYANVLRAAGAGVVLDVRERAWSQRPEFVKSAMREGLAAVGIDYVHVPSAGNPSSIRRNVTSAAECLELYQRHIAAHPQCVGELYSYIRRAAEAGRPACLTCYERDPDHCHRSVLVAALLREDATLQPVHLSPADPFDLRRRMPDCASTRSLHTSAFLHPALFTLK